MGRSRTGSASCWRTRWSSLAQAILFLQGIRRFRGLRILWWPESLLGALAIVAVTGFRYGIDNIDIRILAMSLALGSIGIACGITLLKEMPRGRRVGLTITGVVFTLGGAVHLSAWNSRIRRGACHQPIQSFLSPNTLLFSPLRWEPFPGLSDLSCSPPNACMPIRWELPDPKQRSRSC